MHAELRRARAAPRSAVVATRTRIATRFRAQLRNGSRMHGAPLPLFASHRCVRVDLKRRTLCGHIVTTGNCAAGEMEQVLRHAIMGMLGGGTSEIQRNVIAQRGLDWPR